MEKMTKKLGFFPRFLAEYGLYRKIIIFLRCDMSKNGSDRTPKREGGGRGPKSGTRVRRVQNEGGLVKKVRSKNNKK
jgi:hypothetical protein